MSEAYIHGFNETEQKRLVSQARFLETMVFSGVDFPKSGRILELGCGVGAQTEILLERFPGMKIQCVDLSLPQIAKARERLRGHLESGRVEIERADASNLPFQDGAFDGAFLCWVLEHMPNPAGVLKELRRVLRPGAVLHGIEVMNFSLHINPLCPAMMRYWGELNSAQVAAGGDPFVGAKVGSLLAEAGFREIQTFPWPIIADCRARGAFQGQIDYWENLLLSASVQLLDSGRIDHGTIESMRAEFQALREDPRAAFYYSPMKFSAVAG